MKQKTNLWLTVAWVLLAAAIFVIDIIVFPLGIAGGVPYIAVLLITLWLPRRQHVLYAAIAVSVLTILGYFWSAPAGIPWMVLANRLLTLFAIWVTAMVGYTRKRTEETLHMRDRALAATTIDTGGLTGVVSSLYASSAWDDASKRPILQISPVPEPSTWILLTGGFVGILLLRHRTRHTA